MKQFIFRKFNSEKEMMECALQLFLSHLAIKTEHPSLFLLPGGKTPIPLYKLIAQNKAAIASNIFFALTDERMVPLDAPQSNFNLIKNTFHTLEVSDKNILSIDTSLPLEKAAENYNEQLSAFINKGGKIQLAFLGLGTDGHTASLFSFEDLKKCDDHLAIPIKRPAPPDRISITPLLLTMAPLIVFLVNGREKKNIVDTFLRAPDKVIAARAVFDCEKVFLWYKE
jgi:6-phosphogluconolactonase